MNTIEKTFTNLGGQFCTEAATLKKKLSSVKAFIFDWDGVFNDGVKNENGSSTFNEPDSMGINMLRFNTWLLRKQLPLSIIISGERNSFSFQFANRERFHAVYFKAANKKQALDHLLTQHKLSLEEIAFVYDDILDLSLAQICGVRILINRTANPLFKNYVIENKLADYITANCSGNFPLREACELMIGLSGDYNTTIKHRIDFSESYQHYLNERQKVSTGFFTNVGGVIESVDVKN